MLWSGGPGAGDLGPRKIGPAGQKLSKKRQKSGAGGKEALFSRFNKNGIGWQKNGTLVAINGSAVVIRLCQLLSQPVPVNAR